MSTRATVRIDEALLAHARREASRRGITLSTLFEERLQLVLRQPLRPLNRPFVTLPACRASRGTLPGVNLDDSAALLDRLDR